MHTNETINYYITCVRYIQAKDLTKMSHKYNSEFAIAPDPQKLPYNLSPFGTPWIFNVVYWVIAGKQFKLKWGPNYCEVYQAQFYEISIGEMVIWTTSPAMEMDIYDRECYPSRQFIENTNLPLRMLHKRVLTPLNDWNY